MHYTCTCWLALVHTACTCWLALVHAACTCLVKNYKVLNSCTNECLNYTENTQMLHTDKNAHRQMHKHTQPHTHKQQLVHIPMGSCYHEEFINCTSCNYIKPKMSLSTKFVGKFTQLENISSSSLRENKDLSFNARAFGRRRVPPTELLLPTLDMPS